MLIQQTFALFVFRADRRLGLGIFKGYETNRIQKSVNAVESLSVFEA